MTRKQYETLGYVIYDGDSLEDARYVSRMFETEEHASSTIAKYEKVWGKYRRQGARYFPVEYKVHKIKQQKGAVYYHGRTN